MPAVKTGSTARWARRAAAASGDYKEGVTSSPNNWEANTLAAVASHKAGTEAALRDGRFAKGVAKSGQAYYKERASTIGADRFSSGVEAGKTNYDEGVKPYLEVIAATQLPARGPKGDPRNYDRVRVMGSALRAKKMAS